MSIRKHIDSDFHLPTACSGDTVRDRDSIPQVYDYSQIGDYLHLQGIHRVIGRRYEVLGSIGAGVSGIVVRARDRLSGLLVAVKVMRDVPVEGCQTYQTRSNGYTAGVQNEAATQSNDERMYEILLKRDHPAISLFARIMGSGNHGTLRYVVFDLGGPTLLDVIGMIHLHPLPRRHLREVAVQIVRGLVFMHSSSIVHGDIKPNNIVLRSFHIYTVRRMDLDGAYISKHELASVELFIIDLGESRILRRRGYGIIGANSYRAPEVSLGLPWSYGVDAFALGCVLAELCLAHPLFPYSETTIERLAVLERVVGPFPYAFACQGERRLPGHFDITDRTRVRFPPSDPEAVPAERIRDTLAAAPLARMILDDEYLELCDWLLCLDPKKRDNVADCYLLSFVMRCNPDVVEIAPVAA